MLSKKEIFFVSDNMSTINNYRKDLFDFLKHKKINCKKIPIRKYILSLKFFHNQHLPIVSNIGSTLTMLIFFPITKKIIILNGLGMLKNHKLSRYLFLILCKLNKNTNFVKTHSSMCTIGKYRFTTKKNTKGAIYIVRDPRDVLVSNSYYFGLDYEKTFRQLSSSNVFEYQALTKSYKRFKKSLMGSWADNYNSWKNYKQSPILIIKYEEMILNGYNTFLKIIKYLNKIDGLEIDEEKLKNSFEQTEFKKLRKIEDQLGFEDQAKKGFFFRKGKIGTWKDEVPNEIIKKIEKIFYKEMVELNYL